jgi:hypothetical protein
VGLIEINVRTFGPSLVGAVIKDQILFDVARPEFQATLGNPEIYVLLVVDTYVVGLVLEQEGADGLGSIGSGFDFYV